MDAQRESKRGPGSLDIKSRSPREHFVLPFFSKTIWREKGSKVLVSYEAWGSQGVRLVAASCKVSLC